MSKRKNQMSKHERDLFDNSIERVINTTISILERVEPNAKGNLAEDIDINIQDWNDLKETVVYWWNDKRNELFKKYNDQVLVAHFVGAEDMIKGEGEGSLNIVVKRHIQLLGKLAQRGEPNYWTVFLQYISDAAKEGFVVISNAEEIYSVFVDSSGRPDHSNKDYKQANSYKVQVSKIKRIIQEALQ